MIVTGYASLFGVKDNGKDTVQRGAFQSSLRKRKAKAVKFLWAHKQDEPIGEVTRLWEDQTGLKYEAEIDERMRYGVTAMAAVERGIAEVSMGFRAINPVWKDDGRDLPEVDLRELSLVTIPMLDGTSAVRRPLLKVTISEKSLAGDLESLGVINLALTTAAARLALAAHNAR